MPRKRGYTFSTGQPSWNRQLPYPARKMAGRIVFEVEPGRWVTRQRAWQLLHRGPPRPIGRPRKLRSSVDAEDWRSREVPTLTLRDKASSSSSSSSSSKEIPDALN